MRCLHCGKKISFLRKLSDEEFCSSAHRSAFQKQQEALVLNRLREAGHRLETPLETAPPEPRIRRKTKPEAVMEIPPEAQPIVERLRVVGRLRLHSPPLQPLIQEARPEHPSCLLRLAATGFSGPGLLSVSTMAGFAPFAPRSVDPGWAAPPESAFSVRRSNALALVLDIQLHAGPTRGVLLPVQVPVPLTAACAGAPAPRRMSAMPLPAVPLSASMGMRLDLEAINTAAGQAGPEVAPPPRDAPPLAHLLPWIPALPPSGAQVRPALLPVAAAWIAGAAPSCGTGLATHNGTVSTAYPAAAGPVAVPLHPPLRREIAACTEAAPVWRPVVDQATCPNAWGWSRPEPATPGAVALTTASLGGVPAPFRLPFPAPVAAPRYHSTPALPAPASQAALRSEAGLAALPGAAGLALTAAAPVACSNATPLNLPSSIAAAPSLPALAVGVEQLRFATIPPPEPEPAVTAAPRTEPEGPPMFTGILPIFAGRAVAGGTAQPAFSQRSHQPLWYIPLETLPVAGASGLHPDQPDGSGPLTAEPPRRKLSVSWFRLPRLPRWGGAWRHAPADLKWVSLAIPAVLVLVIYSLIPSQPMKPSEAAGMAAEDSSSPTVLGDRFSTLQKVIMDRAAISLVDDFRSGLGAWSGGPGWARTWQYNAANFVSPGQLAFYAPTAGMRDYSVSFLAQIDRRSLNWVVRAADDKNYHVIRIVITQPGPLPRAVIMRYPVINGRQGRATTLPLPLTIRTDTLYKVRMEVKGNNFITYVQDQVVDSFTDGSLAYGGVGFFSPPGDRALLRWVSVMHQYDYLGRLCALLAPYTVQAEGRRVE